MPFSFLSFLFFIFMWKILNNMFFLSFSLTKPTKMEDWSSFCRNKPILVVSEQQCVCKSALYRGYQLCHVGGLCNFTRSLLPFLSQSFKGCGLIGFLGKEGESYSTPLIDGLCWRLLFDFRSTTMMEMLSELFLPYAISVRLSATACAGEMSSVINNLRHLLRRRRAASPTSSLVMTSQSPSLAKIKHSSSSVLVMKVISGTGIIHGLKYRSPETYPSSNKYY